MPWVLENLPAIDVAILELGANDALRAQNPQSTRANLSQMIKILQKRKIRVLLAGMVAPPNLGQTYGKAFNGLYPALARQYKIALYPFFLDGVAAQRALNLGDGIHPNSQGVKIIVSKILPFVLKTLEDNKNRRKN